MFREKGESITCLRMKFGFYVTRDILGVVLLVNLIVLALGFTGNFLWGRVSDDIIAAFPRAAFLENTLALRLYCFGGLQFFFILGLVGLCFMVGRCCGQCQCSEDPVTYDTYNYRCVLAFPLVHLTQLAVVGASTTALSSSSAIHSITATVVLVEVFI